MGGLDKHGIPVKLVHSRSLSALQVRSDIASSVVAELQALSLVDRASIMFWRQVTKVLVRIICSACESFHGRLLAIGGLDGTLLRNHQSLF